MNPSSPRSSSPPPTPSPFHAGEQAAQRRAGVRERSEALGRRMIHGRLPERHRAFYRQLPLLVVAALDEEGRPWASPLTGSPGFLDSRDGRALTIAARPDPGDPIAAAFASVEAGARELELGALGIELHTRRRNRVNGRLRRRDDGALELEVQQAFGNCPKHIHPRLLEAVEPEPGPAPAPVDHDACLTDEDRALIEGADTFFIASVSPGAPEDASRGADASHRGGPVGFVRVDGPRQLSFPDYAGNNLFNTIGNLTLDARAGLTFINFGTGSLLQLSGRARVRWLDEDDEPLRARFPGARRLVTLEITNKRARPGALPLRLTRDGDDA